MDNIHVNVLIETANVYLSAYALKVRWESVWMFVTPEGSASATSYQTQKL